jgi:hypothetical protein
MKLELQIPSNARKFRGEITEVSVSKRGSEKIYQISSLDKYLSPTTTKKM